MKIRVSFLNAALPRIEPPKQLTSCSLIRPFTYLLRNILRRKPRVVVLEHQVPAALAKRRQDPRRGLRIGQLGVVGAGQPPGREARLGRVADALVRALRDEHPDPVPEVLGERGRVLDLRCRAA